MPGPDDYYPSGEPGEESNLPPEGEETHGGENTALLPKSILGDVAPGDMVTLKVVHVYEDEVAVEKSDEDEGEKPEASPKGMSADQEIDAMMEE